METRKIRTPSAKLLAAKQDEVFDKVLQNATPIASKTSLGGGGAVVADLLTKSSDAPPISSSVSASQNLSQMPGRTQQERVIEEHVDSSLHQNEDHRRHLEDSASELKKEHDGHHQHQHHPTDIDEEIDVSTAELGHAHMDHDDVSMEMHMEDISMKEDKIDGQMILNGDFSVANEVTISSMKYQGRTPSRKVVVPYDREARLAKLQRVAAASSFTGETLNLKSSDLSIPNKAAHFLYFRCYEEHEVQKEFPLTIDEHRKGPQNFLVEPRVGLKNTDYYIDSYLWNRGKSTSSKKKIFVEIEGNHVKTSRRTQDTAHYVLNWYYSNMENRICKKVCWLETVVDNVRASPVLVQYHVNYISDNPIELRKTPKLYSDTRSVAQELLRSDSPLQTVQRFVETGETDPREIINKKQAYEMRRYVMANARKRNMQRKYEDVFYDDELFEEVYYTENGEAISTARTTMGSAGVSEASRIAQMVCRTMGRKIEHRLAAILDSRLPAPKNHAEMVTEWINTLVGSTPEDYDIVIHNVVTSMKKHLDEMLGEPTGEYLEETTVVEGEVPSTSSSIKRMKMMTDDGDVEEDVDEDHVRTPSKQRFEGDRYIFEGQEYVEEEVIAEELPEEEDHHQTSSGNGDVGGGAPKYTERAVYFRRSQPTDIDNVQQ